MIEIDKSASSCFVADDDIKTPIAVEIAERNCSSRRFCRTERMFLGETTFAIVDEDIALTAIPVGNN